MRKRSLRKKGKDPDDFHIEILDFNQDREVYDGSLEENIISQVEEPGTIPVRPAPQRPQQRVQRKKVRRPENLDDFQEEKLPPSPKEKARRKRNRQLTALTYGFVALFICMMAYLVYFNQVRARSFIRDPHNARLDSMAEHIARGPIVDRNGQVLAETVTTDNGEQYRNYPYGSLFAHVVGYDTKGKAGLESVFNFELLTSHASYLEQLKNDLQSKKNPGDTIVTTLDTNLQQAAAQSLGSNKGAAVAIEPDTGKVLLMYSNPTFDPESVSEQWDQLNSDPNSALLNRVTQGAYAPGSTFKIVTALEYLRENGTDANYAYECNGSYTYSDTTIHCYNGAAHGMEDLESSFANSCNASFVNIGLHLDPSKYRTTADSLLFNKKLPSQLPAKKSQFVVDKDTGPGEMMMTAMGQGNTQISPYHLALIGCAVANDGLLMKPYLVTEINNDQNKNVKKYSPKSYKQLLSAEEAAVLQRYMRSVVTDGTGRALNSGSYTAAAKTGTAEYSSDKNKSHSLFVGYANVDHPDIVVAVVIESADQSGASAIAVAKSVFDAYYNQ